MISQPCICFLALIHTCSPLGISSSPAKESVPAPSADTSLVPQKSNLPKSSSFANPQKAIRRSNISSKRQLDLLTLEGEEFDEEYVGMGSSLGFGGNVHVMDSMMNYLKSAVTQILDLSDIENSGEEDRIIKPIASIQKLLEISTVISQITCPAAPENVFKIAFSTFVTEQHARNNLDEMHIPSSTYFRILKALEACQSEAFPLPFYEKKNSSSCQKNVVVSDQIELQGEIKNLSQLPDFAIGSLQRYEPIVEIVWKSFLIVHSYCYRYFHDYINDHHTFTVYATTYFSNRIQETWFLSRVNSTVPPDISQSKGSSPTEHSDSFTTPSPLPSTFSPWDKSFLITNVSTLADSSPKESQKSAYSTDLLWYGNIFGDISKIMQDIDSCYAAAHIFDDGHPTKSYPWFMTRPPRDYSNQW